MQTLLTITDLYNRGWIDPMVATLPDPVWGRHPDHPNSRKPVRLWKLEDVEFAEQDPALQAQLARVEGRRNRREKQRVHRADKHAQGIVQVVAKVQAMFDAAEIETHAHNDPQVVAVAQGFHSGICAALQTPNTPFEKSDRLAAEKLRTALLRKEDKGNAARFVPNTVVSCMCALKDGARSGKLVSQLAERYNGMLVQAALAELRDYQRHRTRIPAQEILAIDPLPWERLVTEGLYQVYLKDYIPARIRNSLTELIAVDPKDEYPYARMTQRQFQIHVGGTNTGKTYQSLQKMAQAESGVYLAPLRLLALEVQDNMLGRGVNCSLLTGEEEDIRPDATHIASTVEKLDVERNYAVAVVDECQMIQDRDRGYAWTRAILGCCAREIHLCTAPEGLDLVVQLIEACGEPYEIIQHERMVPLTLLDEEVPPEEAQENDAFIAFSKRNVLLLADLFARMGKPASVIYGALPYATRCLQMERFLQGKTKILVSTDAIGMGLNLPIRRIIFTADTKFDGYESRPLKPGEVKQIAGRAGRYKVFDEGFVTSSEPTDVIAYGMETPTEPVTIAMLGFSDLVLRVGHDLLDVLRIWNELPTFPPYQRMDVGRYIQIIDLIRQAGVRFTPEQELRAATIPFDEHNDELLEYFLLYCEQSTRMDALTVPSEVAPSLDGLELYSSMLDLYYSCSRAFRKEIDLQWLRQEKVVTADKLNQLLVSELATKGKSCRMCHAPMPLNSSFRICKRCAEKMRKKNQAERQRRGRRG